MSKVSKTLSSLAHGFSGLDWGEGPDPESNLRRLHQNLMRCGIPSQTRVVLLQGFCRQPGHQFEGSEAILAELSALAKKTDGWLPLVPITEGRPQVPEFDIVKLISDPLLGTIARAFFRDELAKAEKALLGMPPMELPTLLASDSTPEGMTRLLATNPDHRLGFFSDEGEFIEIMIGRYSGNPAVERFCKATDGMPITVNRAKGSHVSIAQPLISGCIFSQPIVAARLIEDPAAWEKGVAARFLPCWPESRIGRREVTAPAVPPSVSSWWNTTISALLDADRPGRMSTNPKDELVVSTTPAATIGLSDEASAAFLAWREAMEPRLCPGVGDLTDIGPWAKKLGSYVSRIAMLLHLLQANPGPTVSVKTMTAAISWESFIVGHCRALLAKKGHPKAIKVIEWVQEHKLLEFTKREVLLRLREKGFTTVADWEPVLANLVACGYIRRRPTDIHKRGRVSEIYDVRPEVLES